MTITGAGISPQLIIFAAVAAAAAVSCLIPDLSLWSGATMATFGCSGTGMNPGMAGGFRSVMR